MTQHPCDAEFKAQAAELVRRKTKPADLIADERGAPHKTRHWWLAAGGKHPAEPFASRGRLRADGHRVPKLQRTVRGFHEENAIGTKPGAWPAAAGGMGSVHPRPPLGLLGRAEVPNAVGLPKRDCARPPILTEVQGSHGTTPPPGSPYRTGG